MLPAWGARNTVYWWLTHHVAILTNFGLQRGCIIGESHLEGTKVSLEIRANEH